MEETYKFGSFFSPLLQEGDFEAKPSVLLLGQYSTGKSTFIKYLLGRDYPGIHIGPEPTTDRFVVVHHGPADRTTPGNTLVVQTSKPFTGLSQFGNGFLSKFQGSECDNRILEEITLVDTPGVLSGEKQRIQRGYDFKHVCGWFASRCDLILLLFDPNKLDISDEFRSVMSTLKSHEDKVRIVLNKADQVRCGSCGWCGWCGWCAPPKRKYDTFFFDVLPTGRPAAADAGVRRADVEPWQGLFEPRGATGLHRVVQ